MATHEDTDIVYYCKDCKELIEPKDKGNSKSYACPNGRNCTVAFGLYRSIKNYFHLTK